MANQAYSDMTLEQSAEMEALQGAANEAWAQLEAIRMDITNEEWGGELASLETLRKEKSAYLKFEELSSKADRFLMNTWLG